MTVQRLRIAFLAAVACTVFVAQGHAQQCVLEAPFCDGITNAQGQTIQNPLCTWINHFLLQSDIFTTPSEGAAYNPNGSPCCAEESGVPCGVRTTTNTCSEDAPVTCEPFQPGCLCDPGDPTCDPGGGGDEPCGRGAPCAYSVATVLQGVSQVSPLPITVSSLLQELAAANGIYIKAKVALISSTQGTTTGTYEYWERGGHYRIRLDPSGAYPWSEIAFDGAFTQGKSAPDVTELRRGDERLTPLPDGPLALALAPLRNNDSAACHLCQLRLSDLKNAVTWRHDAAAKLAVAEGATGQGTFDAGLGRTGELDPRGQLARLIWPADQQQHRLEVRLNNYRPIGSGGSGAAFPMKLTESLTPTVSIEYTVEKIDLSPSIQDEVFNLYGTARKIIYTTVGKDGAIHTKVVRNQPTQMATACHPAKASPAGSK